MSNNDTKKNINNTMSNIYSKYRVSSIMKDYVINNKIDYDLCISIRFDFLNKIQIILKNDIEFNKINCYNYNNPSRLYIADHFIITSYKLYIEYSSAYINLNNIIFNKDIKQYLLDVGCGFNIIPEAIVTGNMYLYYKNLYDIIYLNNKILDFH
jgi:hypothetical protein